jgi:AcrR family transcriptional regulator
MAGRGRASAGLRTTTLSREQVLRAAVSLADESGIEALSMRNLGRTVGVEAMSLYNHVSGKDDLLDGMVDLVWGEVEPPPARGGWRTAIHKTAASAHGVLMRHPWACGLAISSGRIHPARIRYIDAILGRLRRSGFSAELAFRAYHAIDGHIIGFTMWLTGHSIADERRDQLVAATLDGFANEFPYLIEHVEQHRAGVGRRGKDEFTFVLDLLLDGLEQMRSRGSASRRP